MNSTKIKPPRNLMILQYSNSIEQVTEETQTQEKKRSQPHTDNTPSPKKKKVKTYEVDLPDAPLDGRSFFCLL